MALDQTGRDQVVKILQEVRSRFPGQFDRIAQYAQDHNAVSEEDFLTLRLWGLLQFDHLSAQFGGLELVELIAQVWGEQVPA